MKKDVMKEHVVQMLQERGVSLDDIAELSWQLQAPYNNELTKKSAGERGTGFGEERDPLSSPHRPGYETSWLRRGNCRNPFCL